MSKVLVDRELLSRAADVLGSQSFSAWDEIAEQLRAFIAQPAEAEGVEAPVVACISSETGELYREDYGLKDPIYLVLQSDHLAALSAVTAERDRLQEQCELNDMVHGTKGRERVAALLAKNEVLSKDAARYRQAMVEVMRQVDGNIRETVRDCVNGGHAVQDIYDYCDLIEEAIRAAMAAKEG